MSIDATEFKEMYEAGYHTEEMLVQFLKENAVNQYDRQTMAGLDFTIPDILNGRIDASVPNLPVLLMIQRWNKAVGFTVIYEDSYK